jgi:transcriptional regulator with XRE-family HTH domain
VKIEERKSDINETISKNLKKYRESQKLSQRKLAIKLNLNQSTVARIETCDRKMLAEELPLFAEALGVSVSELLS